MVVWCRIHATAATSASSLARDVARLEPNRGRQRIESAPGHPTGWPRFLRRGLGQRDGGSPRLDPSVEMCQARHQHRPRVHNGTAGPVPARCHAGSDAGRTCRIAASGCCPCPRRDAGAVWVGLGPRERRWPTTRVRACRTDPRSRLRYRSFPRWRSAAIATGAIHVTQGEFSACLLHPARLTH